MSSEDKSQTDALLTLIKEALHLDDTLRGEHQIGQKFRFIRDRLNALKHNVEENVSTLATESERKKDTIEANEQLVYIYLFNAQGAVLSSWQKLVNPAVFYEYSINRPIYRTQADIDAYIRTKSNRLQHGYITIAVKKSDVVNEELAEDRAQIKIKEGSFKIDRFISFTHNGQEYLLNASGQLIKKTD